MISATAADTEAQRFSFAQAPEDSLCRGCHSWSSINSPVGQLCTANTLTRSSQKNRNHPYAGCWNWFVIKRPVFSGNRNALTDCEIISGAALSFENCEHKFLNHEIAFGGHL
jgi:hypothetical protein